MTHALRRLIAREVGFPTEEIASDARLREDLGLDDFDIIELIEALETALFVRHVDLSWCRSPRVTGRTD
jgi:acyl carrier protein